MPKAGFEPMVSVSQQSRPTPQTVQPLGLALCSIVIAMMTWHFMVHGMFHQKPLNLIYPEFKMINFLLYTSPICNEGI
jgi:hypothetical protein